MDNHDDEVPAVPFLEDPLDSGGAPASTDALRQVLNRHRSRQLRIVGASLAAVLAVGGVAGFLIGQSNSASPSTHITASAADRPAAPAPASETATAHGSVAMAGANPGKWTQLVLRNATDGTRVRFYSQDITPPTVTCVPAQPCPQQAKAACAPTQSLLAEVSDDQVAGETGGPVWQTPTGTFDGITAQVIGAGQPQPILVVIGHTSSNVAKVVLKTSYATDTLAPSAGGWAALAQQLPSTFQSSTTAPANVPAYKLWPGLPDGTITALSSTGATLATVSLASIDDGTMNMPCGGPVCTTGGPAPAPGSPPATHASGSASTQASGSASSTASAPATNAAPPTNGPCPTCPPPPAPGPKQTNGGAPATSAAGGQPMTMCGYSSGSAGASGSGTSNSGSSSGGTTVTAVAPAAQ